MEEEDRRMVSGTVLILTKELDGTI